MPHIFTLLWAVILCLGACLPTSYTAAPQGTQCPTAAVQQITKKEWVKNCCGHWELKSVTRAPRAGDAEFTQCRCAEKKAGHDEAIRVSIETPEAIPPAQGETLAFHIPCTDAPEFSEPISQMRDHVTIPFIPPPNSI